MSAALHPVRGPGALPPPPIGPGTRARLENDRWRGRDAAEVWLAQHRAARGDVDLRRSRKFERDSEYRARKRCAAKRLGTDRATGEVDPTIADLRPGAAQAINAANAREPRRELPDLQGLRHRDPGLWRNILRYLRGCPRAREIIWYLDAGIPHEQMAARMGITQRAVNMAHATLRRRMAAMRKGEPVPAGRPEPAGAEFEEVAVSGPEPAADLFAARNVAAPVQPALKTAKRGRRKAETPSLKLDLYDSAATAAHGVWS